MGKKRKRSARKKKKRPAGSRKKFTVLLRQDAGGLQALLGHVRRRDGKMIFCRDSDVDGIEKNWRDMMTRAGLKSVLPSPLGQPWVRFIDDTDGRTMMLWLLGNVRVIASRKGGYPDVRHLKFSVSGIQFSGSGDRYLVDLDAQVLGVSPDLSAIAVRRNQKWGRCGLHLDDNCLLDFGTLFPDALITAFTCRAQDTPIAAERVQEIVDDARREGVEHLIDDEILAKFSATVSDQEPTPVLTLSQHALWPPSQRLAVAIDFRYPDPSSGRNGDFEKAANAQIKATKAIRSDMLSGGYYADAKRILRAIPELAASGWAVESCGSELQLNGNMHFDVTEDGDALDLQISIRFGDQEVVLSDALEARDRGETTVQLPNGGIAVLPERALLQLRFLEVLNQRKKIADGVRLRKNQAVILNQWLNDAESDTSFSGSGNWRDSLTALDAITPEMEIAPSADFVGELRDYQKRGLAWLRYLRQIGYGGCLADDMGLGKTIQVLAYLLNVHEDATLPSLIVAPRSLLDNWYREAGKFAPSLKVAVVHGSWQAENAQPVDEADLVLTTYGTLRSKKNNLLQRRYATCILDEAQAIKNPTTLAAQAVRLVRADHRLCLTGTPIENHLGDLWSLFDFLNPGLLGTSLRFSFFITSPTTTPGSHSLRALSTFLHPFILRRTKDAVLPELPDKTETTIYCELPPAQRQAYDALRDVMRNKISKAIESDGLAKSKFTIFEVLLRLRQCACHPALVDDEMREVGSAKLDFVMNRATELREEGHKVLIFSQFTSLLALLRERLDEASLPYAYLDGKTQKRQEQVDRFQEDPDVSIFLLSLKAGGSGLNLTAASYVFILDPWWNPATERQAVDRAHRLGQKQPVFAYRIVAKDTVEERILAMQNNKKALADAILTADKSVMKRLTAADLEALLG